MKAADALVCLHLALAAYAADHPRPRGVGPDFAKFYKDATTFSCISDPSIKLPISRLNDDYCDCPDGSDEPGTSACAHLSPRSLERQGDALPNVSHSALRLPGFYCKNKGHIASYLPFINVNDGRCDYDLCCDGSEEWSGLVKCEDRCAQIGSEWRKADEARRTSRNNAVHKRKELVAEAARVKKQVQDRIQSLGTEIEGGELRVKQLEKELVEVERTEKHKVVRVRQTGGKLGVLVGLAQQRVTELRENLNRVRQERDESRGRLAELEGIMTTFKDEYNPNFNDEGVKRAVRAWEDYAAQVRESSLDSGLDGDLDTILGTDKDNGLDWDEFAGDGESDTDVLYSFENYLPPSMRTWLDQKLRDLRIALVDAGILASGSDSSNESKAVTSARGRLESAKDDLEGLQKTLTEHKEDLERDFGPDEVFRALKGKCIDVDSGEYNYEVCFMESTVQKPKKGGAHTGMGKFERFDTVVVDDVLPPDGKGLGTGERLALRYENGQHCWNGPHRSTLVVLACAEEPAIWKVIEEEKCVYRMEVGTPAVCHSSNGSAKKADGEIKRDEL